MNRRKFIGLLTLGLAGSAVGVFSLPSFENIAEDIILKDTAKLPLSAGAIQKYIVEVKDKNIWKNFNFAKREFFRAHYFFSNALFKLPYHSKYLQYRSEIVGNFLLSTDFFTNKMNTEDTINYVAIYDPYFRPCANPFSSIYYNA